jgi:hypothetical protein
MDINLIIKKLKEYLNIESDKELADYLGIKTNVLGNWKKRNTFDMEVLFTRCEFVFAEWFINNVSVRPDVEIINEVMEPDPNYGCLKCSKKDKLINQLIGENNILREQAGLKIPDRNKKVI